MRWRRLFGEGAKIEVGFVFGLMGFDMGQEALVETVEAEDFLVEGVKESVLLGDDGLKLDDAAFEGFVCFHGGASQEDGAGVVIGRFGFVQGLGGGIRLVTAEGKHPAVDLHAGGTSQSTIALGETGENQRMAFLDTP